MIITAFDAIYSLVPNASFGYKDGVITWMDDTYTQPSDEEIQAEIIRLQAEYDSKDYQRKRAAEYPSFADQFDKIFHEGVDAWKTQIQTIKDKYPKA